MSRTPAALMVVFCLVSSALAQSHDGWTATAARAELAPVSSVKHESGGKYALAAARALAA